MSSHSTNPDARGALLRRFRAVEHLDVHWLLAVANERLPHSNPVENEAESIMIRSILQKSVPHRSQPV